MRQFANTATETWYSVRFDDVWHQRKVTDMETRIEELFDNVLANVRENGVNQDDLVRLHLKHPQALANGDITVSLRRMRELNGSVVANVVSGVIQSNNGLAFDHDFEIGVGVISLVRGSAYRKITKNRGKWSDIAKKRSMVTIKNHHGDTLCMARSLAVCEAHAQQDGTAKTINQYRQMCEPTRRKQYRRAVEIQLAAGFPVDYIPDVIDIPKFEDSMNAQIVILAAHRTNGIAYAGLDRPQKYFLYFMDGENGI
jgi:hypothetical protein